MLKRNTAAVLFIIIMTAAACLAGCGSGQPANQGNDQEAAWQDVHEAYGVSYVVPETEWSYMFDAEQLGSGEEWVDLDISGRKTEEGLKEYWNKARQMDIESGEDSVLKDSGIETIDGRKCYWYDRYSGGPEEMPYWSKVLLIPQAGGNKFIEIRSDFIEEADKDKADAFFDELLKSVEFTDDGSFAIDSEHISAGGVKFSAQGLETSQLFYGLMYEGNTDGLVSMQVDFDYEDYAKGPEQAFADMDWEDDSTLKNDGTVGIGGVPCKWYAWTDSLPDSMTYMSYVVMIPNDELEAIMCITYDFDAEKEGVDNSEEMLKKLVEQIHIAKSGE